jgi:glycerol kinase
MEFLSGLLGVPLEVPACDEATALGIAFMAGLKAGVYGSEEELERRWRCARRYEPDMNDSERREHIARHRRAVRHVLAWGGNAPL